MHEEFSSEEFKRLYDRVPGWIFKCRNDEAWTMTRTNSRMQKILGFTEEEFAKEKKNSIAAVTPEPYMTKVRSYTTQTMERGIGSMHSYVTPVVRKDGSYCWLNVELYCDDIEEDGMWYVSCADITEMKKQYDEEMAYQDAVNDEDVLMKTRANITKDYVESIYTIQAFTLPDQSRTFSGGVSQLASRAYDEKEREKLCYQLSEKRMRLALEEDGIYNFEYMRRSMNNHPSWAQVYVRTFLHPETEDLIAFVYLKDVNEERKISSVLNKVSDISKETLALVYLDTDEMEVIKFYEEYHEISINTTISYTENARLYAQHFLREEIRDEAMEKFSIESIRKHLELNPVYECIYGIGDDQKEYKRWEYTYFDQKNGIVIYKCTDVTDTMLRQEEQKKALKDAFKLAEQGSRAKGSFLSNMSHEIRTPLNAIIGYLSIASDKDSTLEKKNYCIENCQTASKHLLQIINDVLDMSSIENGKLKIAQEEFDLKKEIADVTTIFYQNAKIKKVHFECHVENVTEEWVVGDQLRVNQILMNLLSNAVKFTPEDGTVQLKVEQLRKDDQKVYMKFTVQDTGIGMSKEYMSRIFHPFEQENAGTAKKFGGSGLGLSITSNLVQMMGGKIDVQSEPGEGTTFEVTMFFTLSTTGHASNVYADYSHVRVLVVDDRDVESSYIKMMLKRCGAKADTVSSGENALKRIRSRQGGEYSYDLCIIDWNMPGMDGCEVTRKIRAELGEEMPIIIATAYDVVEFEEEAKAAGANKIIAKPLFQSTLFDILVSSFGGYDPEAGQENSSQINLAGVHVLLAEDNLMNMEIAVTILEKAGVKIDQAYDGKEASDQFLASEKGTYDLILMDVQMPVMDGYEATAKIRESSHPEAKTIPIVAMTANAFAEDVAEALSKGMNAHIAKPISYDKLFAILKRFSDRKHA